MPTRRLGCPLARARSLSRFLNAESGDSSGRSALRRLSQQRLCLLPLSPSSLLHLQFSAARVNFSRTDTNIQCRRSRRGFPVMGTSMHPHFNWIMGCNVCFFFWQLIGSEPLYMDWQVVLSIGMRCAPAGAFLFSFPPISAVAQEHVDVEYSFFACASH